MENIGRSDQEKAFKCVIPKGERVAEASGVLAAKIPVVPPSPASSIPLAVTFCDQSLCPTQRGCALANLRENRSFKCQQGKKNDQPVQQQ